MCADRRSTCRRQIFIWEAYSRGRQAAPSTLTLSIELEHPKAGESSHAARSTRVVLLRREPSDRFAPRQDSRSPKRPMHLIVTFATLPNGNAFCGVCGFTRVYELEPKASDGSFTLKAYHLPAPLAHTIVCAASEWAASGASQSLFGTAVRASSVWIEARCRKCADCRHFPTDGQWGLCAALSEFSFPNLSSLFCRITRCSIKLIFNLWNILEYRGG